MEMAVKKLAKTNIVLLADCLADLMGGAERQIYELAKGLDKDRYAVTVASLECVGRAPRHLIEEAGCQFVDFRVKRIYGLSGFVQGIRFWKFLRREKIQILQTYHFSSDIWGTVIARLAGVRYVISNRRDMGFWRSRRHVAAYKWVNRRVAKIVVVSQSIRSLIKSEESVPDEKIEVVCNGIRLTDTAYSLTGQCTRESLKISPDDTVIMHVANLTPVKGHQYLIDAMARTLPKYPKARLVLVGDGPLRENISAQVSQLGMVERVLFLGRRADARQLLELADICVLPSSSEGMSNAILEYMAAGKPVIAARVGGNPELIDDGQTGILVEKENAADLADALMSLLENAGRCQAMGRCGLERVRNRFTMEAMIDAYERLYSGFFENKKPIKVLHLVSSNGLYGAEQVILNIAQNPEINSHVGAVCNLHNPHLEVIEEARKIGLKTAVFDSRGRLDYRTIGGIRRFLKENRIDILHTHNYKSDLIGFCAVLHSRTKWVATNHVWHGLDRKLRFYERLDAFILRFAKQIAAVSDEIKKDLEAKHISKEKIHVIDNGINIGLFQRSGPAVALKADLKIATDDRVVTIVGRLSPEKGHKILFKAAGEICDQRNDVKFLVVGDGPLRSELESQAAGHNLNGRVIFTGIRKDMPDIYALSDVMVNASSTEGLPMTILEAMAAKVPLIVTPVGAVSRVIEDGVNGVVVPVGDERRLSEAIRVLLDDSALGERLAARAYKDVCGRFSSAAMVARYRKMYEEALK